MKFKSPELETELKSTSVLLQHMVDIFDGISQEFFGKEIIITRVFERVKGSSGVHEDQRAFDVRCQHDGGFLYSDAEIKLLVDTMNNLYPRNDGRPTCLYHSFCGGPFHFHVQLATSTKTYAPAKKN